ncbi:MAG: glyoxylate/hydroxypyruvate reductase A [Alphaproteobacteria bacterium]
MPAILFHSQWDDPEAWRRAITNRIPGLELRVWPEVGERADIAYAFVENLPAGELAKLPNLKAILSPGAGVDHLFRDPALPRHLPMVKVVQDRMTRGIVQYVVLHVLRHHRRMPEYQAQQRERLWQELKQPGAWDRRVGVMGLGTLGRASVKALVDLGFQVAGWSRTRKRIKDVETYAGADEFQTFLARTEILVCLLALTPETRGIVNARSIATLPAGASFVNLARGRHVIEADLLAALDSGHLSHATLDVFHEEPLPPTSRFWSHPRVTVTPHRAGNSNRLAIIDQMLDAIERLEAGRPLRHRVDARRGY